MNSFVIEAITELEEGEHEEDRSGLALFDITEELNRKVLLPISSKQTESKLVSELDEEIIPVLSEPSSH
jgi:hypothetical protein